MLHIVSSIYSLVVLFVYYLIILTKAYIYILTEPALFTQYTLLCSQEGCKGLQSAYVSVSLYVCVC